MYSFLLTQIKAYNKEKYEREMAFEEELKKQKSAKDHEIAKIQASQKAWQDLQAEKDELNAIRTQDKVNIVFKRKTCENNVKMNRHYYCKFIHRWKKNGDAKISKRL